MKTLLFAVVIILSISSCCKVVYPTLGSTPEASLAKAKAMVAHYQTSPMVSRKFEDLLKYFRIDKKAIKKLSKSEHSVNFINAAYLDDYEDATMRNQPTVILQLVGKTKNDGTVEYQYVDILKIKYAKCKKYNKDGMSADSVASAVMPTELCPPPKTCKIPALD